MVKNNYRCFACGLGHLPLWQIVAENAPDLASATKMCSFDLASRPCAMCTKRNFAVCVSEMVLQHTHTLYDGQTDSVEAATSLLCEIKSDQLVGLAPSLSASRWSLSAIPPTKPPLHAALMPIKGLNQATLPGATAQPGRLKFNVASAVRMWARIPSVFSFDLLVHKYLACPILWTVDNGTVSPIVPRAQSYFLCNPHPHIQRRGRAGQWWGTKRGSENTTSLHRASKKISHATASMRPQCGSIRRCERFKKLPGVVFSSQHPTLPTFPSFTLINHIYHVAYSSGHIGRTCLNWLISLLSFKMS